MAKESWFDSLTMIGLRKHHFWLTNLPTQVETIVNFGCMSGSEPFALIWTLDAKEVTVIEIDKYYIEVLNNEIDIVSHRYPKSLQGRTIKLINGDMTKPLPELSDQYFDLAYCEDILYAILLNQGSQALEQGIMQMVRVVKPNGYIIAVEPKFGAEFETVFHPILKIPYNIPIQKSEPKDMSYLFSSKELQKIDVVGCPQYAYCYQKANNQ